MSARSERVIYKERDRESERTWDEPRHTYTTIKRYKVPDSVAQSVLRDDDDVREDKIIIKRERKDETSSRDDIKSRVSERTRDRGRARRSSQDEIDIRFQKSISSRSRDPSRRDVSYRIVERENDYDRSSTGERRVIERDRSVLRVPSPPSPGRAREFRVERQRDFSPLYREDAPYELERYSKSTEFFQPQPIIIREPAPQQIVIREERREPQRIIIRREEPHYEFIEREEVKEEKSLIKQEEVPAASIEPESRQPEEDYFYERRIIERNRDRKRDESEIRPRDSASQYSSDDSYEYVRRERTYEGDRNHSPHHKRHLAEGALAGIAAGEIIRHHKKAQGEKPGSRARSIVGGAALGAVGAEAISRVRSMHRASRSRSRSRSRGHRRRRHESRSRSKSHSRAQQLGGLAAVAAVGALAGYALTKSGNKETVIVNDRRRSRSRRRRASADPYLQDNRGREALNPEHRNRRIAQAGLVSAAAAGLWETVQSRSRGGKGRSRSRLRQGVPIAAAGLGGAALAGLYEKNKANKEAKREAIIEDELRRGRRRQSRSRSRSRSRSVPAQYHEDLPGRDRGLIAYGHEPIYPEGPGGAYSDEEPGMYRRRHRGGSDSGSSPDTRRNRSQSQDRRWAGTGGAAGVPAFAAHEYDQARDHSRSRQPPYAEDPYGQHLDPVYSSGPQQSNAYQQQSQQNYPSSTYFPPPPTGEFGQADTHMNQQNSSYPVYNPADYAHGNMPSQPSNRSRGLSAERNVNENVPYPRATRDGEGTTGGSARAAHGQVEDDQRRDPENMV